MPGSDVPAGFSLDPTPAAPSSVPTGFALDPVASTPSSPQMTGWQRYPAMFGTSIVKGASDLIQSLTEAGRGGPASYEDPFFSLGRMATDPSYRPAFSPVVPEGAPGVTPGVPEQLRQAGVMDRPDLEPQDRWERILTAGGQGVGATLPTLAMPGVGGALGVGRTLFQGGT